MTAEVYAQLRRPSAIDRHIDIRQQRRMEEKGKAQKREMENREMKRKSMNLKGA